MRQRVGQLLGSLSKDDIQSSNNKSIVFIRHGCTFMNEYLGRGNEFGSPNFSDVFATAEDLEKFRDSKLSPLGVNQAKALARRLTKKVDSLGRIIPSWSFPGMGTKENEISFDPRDLDLIVVSPLTRALQTFDIGLKPALVDYKPKVIAQPLASERVYLISDQGRHRSDLERDWGHDVCFESCFRLNNNKLIEEWWFGLDDQRSRMPATRTGITSKTYQEWRPSSQNQRYACPAEDEMSFEKRMRKFYHWLEERPEATIAVVCHWGVIDWFLGRDFHNCEVGVIPFNDIQPATLLDLKENEEALKLSP